MENPIVISFRGPGGPGRSFLERARALDARARAHGALLVAWDASRVSFSFDATKLTEALALLSVHGDDTAPGELPFCVGLAQGPLSRLATDGSRADLSWGAPLISASVLSQTAEPGEVLCAQSVRALASGELLSAGSRVGRDGALRVRGARLDSVNPWRRQAVEHLSHMRVAPLVGEPPRRSALEPGSLLVLRADPGTGGSRYLSELAARSPRALMVVPTGGPATRAGALDEQ